MSPGHRRNSAGGRAGRWALLAAAAALLPACDHDAPALPVREPPGTRVQGAVVAPPAPGRSREFDRMEVPPGQLTRAIPIGEAWPASAGPLYRSRCLSCHSVSQTSFAVRDWGESAHARAGITCSSCHGTHEELFVPQPGPDRCATCHSRQVEEFLGSAHGPERAPGMRCVSCHETHATDRGLVRSMALCTGCHLGSEHVQGFRASRMGLVLAEHPPGPSGEKRAPDCVHCHFPASSILRETGDFRNDRVTLHDPSVTVARHPSDPSRLAPETIEFLVPLCTSCHSERNARYRLENADRLILHWTPLGMSAEVRRRPSAGDGFSPLPTVRP